MYADNVYTVLTARELNSNLYIVSRAINKNANERLKKAGANNTISPNEIGGSRMAALMLRPTVIAFLDIVTHDGDLILDLEEVTICEDSIIVNRSLMEAKIPEKTGLIILAIKKKSNGKLVFNPSSNQVLKSGDTMVVIGTDKQLHFIIIEIVGMFIYLVVNYFFKAISKYSVSVLSFIYTATVLVVIVFGIEIEQKITNRGHMEFADIISGIWGFTAFFVVYLIIYGCILLVKKYIKRHAEKRSLNH